jgi:hypothetical protein
MRNPRQNDCPRSIDFKSDAHRDPSFGSVVAKSRQD